MSLVEELKGKTVFELKAYAKKNNIDLFGTKTKNEIVFRLLNRVLKFKNPKWAEENIDTFGNFNGLNL